jgi:hypothetical protein
MRHSNFGAWTLADSHWLLLLRHAPPIEEAGLSIRSAPDEQPFGVPPLRQKKGAKTGHGAFVPGPKRVHFSRNSPRRVKLLRMTDICKGQ